VTPLTTLDNHVPTQAAPGSVAPATSKAPVVGPYVAAPDMTTVAPAPTARSKRVKPHYYYARILDRLARMVEPGARVLDVGCGTGEMLAHLKPSVGVGIDTDAEAIATGRARHRGLRFINLRAEALHTIGDTFDYVILSQVLGEIYDLSTLLKSVEAVCHERTRVIVVQYSRLWQPALKVAEWFGIKRRIKEHNWLPADEIEHQLSMAGFDTVHTTGLTLMPVPVPVVSWFVNRFVAHLPLVRQLCLSYITVARPTDVAKRRASVRPSLSIVVPARNEAGNIEPLLERIPHLAPRQEVIFVEGHSEDDTWDVIQRVVRTYDGPFILRSMRQPGKGKGDAVRCAFAEATGDVLMILDADISVPPEELRVFYDAIVSGHGEFINGSRLVYMMDDKAMRFLNLLANKMFGWLFTFLINQRCRDTLCGTKVLTRRDYERIARNRSYFGDFDPFGDFDLLFGAARLQLKIIDVPVHYKARTYGDTNISRFRHGLMLLRMCGVAARKLKFV